MSHSSIPLGSRVQSIFHPSDFSEASEVAFAHALKFALISEARLTMLHVAAKPNLEWHDFPGVRETLERWKLIPKDSPKSAVAALGLDVHKVVAAGNNPVKACLRFLEQEFTDLIVLAIRQQEGRMGWLQKSVGTPMARRAGEITLFIPHGVEGFVSRQDGSVSLGNILIPVTNKPSPEPALEAARRIIINLGVSAGTVTLLHVGPSEEMPALTVPEETDWTWNRLAQTGDPAETILRVADNVAADLIVMTTDGPDGFLDGLRGTTSELVLRKARCPVASLPAGSLLG